jgi:hypothetical protein
MIAAKFNLSEHTVKVHIHNTIKKLGAQNRTAAAAIFLARAAGVNRAMAPSPAMSGSEHAMPRFQEILLVLG